MESIETSIQYKISRKAKHISIRIKRDASHDVVCIVVVPFRKNSLFQHLLLQKAKIFVQTKREWVARYVEKYKKTSLNTKNKSSKIPEKELKAQTLKIVLDRLMHFNTFYNFTYKDVRVKKVLTRWGSCSRRGNLNFSHRLGLMKPEEIDYVVVHELCHLAEFNHGPKFWKLVERTIPNYKQIRKGMRGVV